MSGKILHIGGCMDGYRKPAPVATVFQVASYAPRNRFSAGSTYDNIFPQVKTEFYHRKGICRADGSCLEVAVCDNLRNTDLADLLIKGYRGHRNPRRK